MTLWATAVWHRDGTPAEISTRSAHGRQCALTGNGLSSMVIDVERQKYWPWQSHFSSLHLRFLFCKWGDHSGTHLGGLFWRWDESIRIRCLEKHLCVECFLTISPDSMMGSVVVCARLSLDSVSLRSRVLIHVVCSISDTWALEMKITENKNLIVFYFGPCKGKRFKFWTMEIQFLRTFI